MTDITTVSGTTPVQNTGSTGMMGNQQFSTDLFLQLLVTQLRYQDPMSGSQDTGELITQLTMFTLLEQVIQLQQSVEQQANYQGQQQALGLLNKQVEVTGFDGLPVNGTVSAVDFRSSGPHITVGDFDYPLSSLVRVEGGGTEDGE